MREGSSSCGGRFRPHGVNNNANTTSPCCSQKFAGGPIAQNLISKLLDCKPKATGICFNTCNDQPFETDCRDVCSRSMSLDRSVPPTLCAKLDFNLNEKATKLRLRSELPHLSRRDISKLRLPFYDVLCDELLENGYHTAFSEIFNLHQHQESARQAAGPDSPLWFVPPLAEQTDKLVLLAEHMAQVELAKRRMDRHTVFTSYLSLGLAFQTCPDDQWVAEHFFRLAKDTSQKITDDGGLKFALANQYVGVLLQEKGEIGDAFDCFSQFYELARDKTWKNDEDVPLATTAATLLAQNYLSQIDSTDAGFHSDRLDLAFKAHEIAQQCDDWEVQSAIWMRIGQLNEEAGFITKAIDHYCKYYDEAFKHEHYKSLGQACEALARLCQSEKKYDEGLRYLQKYAAVCERNGDWTELMKACQLLGSAYDTIGDHNSALLWMRKAYNMPNVVQCLKEKLSPNATEKARIMIGISRAHMMLCKYTHTVQREEAPSLLKLASWKAFPKDENKLFTDAKSSAPTLLQRNHLPVRDIMDYSRDPLLGTRY